MKKEQPGFGTKNKPFLWCKHHLMWCMYTSDQCKVGCKQADERTNKKKPSSRHITREYAMAAMIDIFGDYDESSKK